MSCQSLSTSFTPQSSSPGTSTPIPIQTPIPISTRNPQLCHNFAVTTPATITIDIHILSWLNCVGNSLKQLPLCLCLHFVWNYEFLTRRRLIIVKRRAGLSSISGFWRGREAESCRVFISMCWYEYECNYRAIKTWVAFADQHLFIFYLCRTFRQRYQTYREGGVRMQRSDSLWGCSASWSMADGWGKKYTSFWRH